MKRAISYLFLTSYILVHTNSVVLILKDKLQHTFNKFEHLAIVHLENGHFHLHNEIVNSEKDSMTKSDTQSGKKNTQEIKYKSENKNDKSLENLFANSGKQEFITYKPKINLGYVHTKKLPPKYFL